MICWTLGITEHHNAVDNVLALINLALLTGKVGRYGCGLNPLRGQNNVQGGGDMGAIPNRLPGFQDLEDPAMRAPFERAWNARFPPKRGYHLSQMFESMEHGEMRAVYIVGENPARSEADQTRAVRLLSGLEHLVVQDIFLTQTAELAHVVLPAAAGWAESEGTVTSSERRVQRVRRALEPPAGRVTTSRSSARSRGASGATGASRPPSRYGTNAEAFRRCTPACPTHGSTSWAASSGRALRRTIPARNSCMRDFGRTRSRVRARPSPSSSTILRSTG